MCLDIAKSFLCVHIQYMPFGCVACLERPSLSLESNVENIWWPCDEEALDALAGMRWTQPESELAGRFACSLYPLQLSLKDYPL